MAGDAERLLERLTALELAGPEDLSFLLDRRHLGAFRRTRAGAVLLPEALAGEHGGPPTRILVADPGAALSRAALLLHSPGGGPAPGVDPSARVAAGVTVPADCSVGPHATIEAGVVLGSRNVVEAGAVLQGGVVTGADCRIGPNAVCYAGTRLGNRVVLKAGAVVGGPGFGFHRDPDGHARLPHLGGCVLEDEVEIGSCSTVDRGMFEDTVIGRGTKIDNLVQVGHNVRMGARCLVMATTGIAGSCRIGDDVVIAGGVGIADHVTIGPGAVIAAKSVVFGPGRVDPGAVVSGYPARPHREFLRAQAALYRLAPHVGLLEALARGTRDAASHHRPSR